MPREVGGPVYGRESPANFNDRVLDFVRAALGIPRSLSFGLAVPTTIVPVLVVDPDSPPLLQYKGIRAHLQTAVAANFSTMALQNIGGAGGILKCWFTLYDAPPSGVQVRVNQGAETTYSTGFTTGVDVASSDSRVAGVNGTGLSGVARAFQRASLAAPWAPPASVNIGFFNPSIELLEIGPFWLDQFDAVSVESAVVNEAVGLFWRFEYFAPVR